MSTTYDKIKKKQKKVYYRAFKVISIGDKLRVLFKMIWIYPMKANNDVSEKIFIYVGWSIDGP